MDAGANSAFRTVRGWRTAAFIFFAWTLVALAWTPPTILIQPGLPPLSLAAFIYLSFIAWMAVTPLLLLVGRRYPIGTGHIWSHVGLHVLIGVAIIPLTVVFGRMLGAFALLLAGAASQQFATSNVAGGILINSLYSVPTYIAAVAVIQAFIHLDNSRIRERLLARAQLQALQAQINPHFLFNMLNAISALRYRDAALADKALT